VKNKENSFQNIKNILTNALVIVSLKFSKTFELECDASKVGIYTVLLQDGHQIAYFS